MYLCLGHNMYRGSGVAQCSVMVLALLGYCRGLHCSSIEAAMAIAAASNCAWSDEGAKNDIVASSVRGNQPFIPRIKALF